ncbi:MAG: Gfo/Idh/MocA family oxidoreductase [Chloroflexota bacterium]
MNFALIGAAGYVAPRHMKAIRDTGHRLVAATDPHDAVGILDRYSFDVRFFPEIERFDRHLDKLRRGPEESRMHWVSVCSPNYLHDAHIRLALRNGADVLCEKPLVINPWNLDQLEALEQETGRRIRTVLQLRVHPALQALKEHLNAEPPGSKKQVTLTYVTSRGPWYHVSWKGREDRSGGVAANIGIHFFDLLLWLFGKAEAIRVFERNALRMRGELELEGADVVWKLSVDRADLPFEPQPGGKTTYRSITVDGQEVEFTEGFTDLHTRVYEETLAGRGFGIADARPSIELVYRIRTVDLTPGPSVGSVSSRPEPMR